MFLKIPRSPSGEIPGTWHPWAIKGRREFKVEFCCPKCGKSGMLAHEIDPSGKVTPSVMCVSDDCGFHEFIELLEWPPKEYLDYVYRND